MLPRSLHWTGEHLELLDQRRLPREVVLLRLQTWEEVVEAISSMAVRGAPAIGVAAAWGVLVLSGFDMATWPPVARGMVAAGAVSASSAL